MTQEITTKNQNKKGQDLKLKVRNLNLGAILEGTVISKKKGEIFVDLSPFGTGRLYGIFYLQSKEVAQKVKVGDRVGVQIINFDDGYGNLEIILKDAVQIDRWQKILEYQQNKTILELEIKDANRGGWIVEVEGIQGFIPVSQLSPEYYPRVNNNKEAILEHLKKFVGQKIKCRVWIVEPTKNKLVLSEKLAKEETYQKILSQFRIGEIIEVTVVGTSNFGVFVRFWEEPPIDGLIHISEIPEELASDLALNFPKGKKLKAKIIQIKQDRVNFSLKDLKPDPWIVIEERLTVGSRIKGVLEEKNNIFGIVRINLDNLGEIRGFVFENLEKLDQNQEYEFVVESLNLKERNLILKLIE